MIRTDGDGASRVTKSVKFEGKERDPAAGRMGYAGRFWTRGDQT